MKEATKEIKEKYIAKKYWNAIEAIFIEKAYDKHKNREYNRYVVDLKEGYEFAGCGGNGFEADSINELKRYCKDIDFPVED